MRFWTKLFGRGKDHPGTHEDEALTICSLCAEIMDITTCMLAKTSVKKSVNMIELSGFAMFVATETHMLARKGDQRASPVLDRFHLDMTNFVTNQYFLKQNPGASEDLLWRFFDYFPELLRIRYPEYRTAFQRDLKPNTIWRSTSESLMGHLFTEPLTPEETATLLIPLGLAIALSYAIASQAEKPGTEVRGSGDGMPN